MKAYFSHSVAGKDEVLLNDLMRLAAASGLALFQAPRPWEPKTLMPAFVRSAILDAELFLVWAMREGTSLYYVNMEMSFVRNVRPQLPVFVFMDKNAPRTGFLQLAGAGSRYGGFWFDPQDPRAALGHAHHLSKERRDFRDEMGEPLTEFLTPAIERLYRHLGWNLPARTPA